MTERQAKVLQLIELKKNILELKSSLNLNDKELIRVINSLVNQGYNVENRYNIEYGHYLTISKHFSNTTKIRPNKSDEKFSVIAISDTHFISPYEDRKAIDQIYELTEKQGIKYVFHMGDFVHGGDSISGYTFNQKQFFNLLKEYPEDNNITTFLVLGNHDFLPIKKQGFNIVNAIKANRLDIIPIGIDEKINIGYSNIEICHTYNQNNQEDNLVNTNSRIILKGHKHIYKIEDYINEENINSIMINAPSLTNMIQDRVYKTLQKGFIKMDITMKNSKFKEATITQYMIDDKPIIVSEHNHQFYKIKK